MSKGDKPYVILVAIDYAETGELALERAFELVAERPNSELHVLHVLPLNLPALGPDFELDVAKSGLPTLDEASKRLALHLEARVRAFRARRAVREGAVRVVPHLGLALPALEIARVAAELEPDLVVVGTRGRRSLSRFLRGSVAEVAVRLCPCSVLVVRPKTAAAGSAARAQRPARRASVRRRPSPRLG
jgi:nucleotide-binding universal stress UspA family protein